MNKNLFAIMALATMPTLIFAQQTESSTESSVKLKEKPPNSNTINRDILLIPTVTIDGNTIDEDTIDYTDDVESIYDQYYGD